MLPAKLPSVSMQTTSLLSFFATKKGNAVTPLPKSKIVAPLLFEPFDVSD
jgi:hypothetical protein